MTEIDNIADSLLLLDVHAGWPEKRQALASQLFTDGVTQEDVDYLGLHCARTTDGDRSAARVLFAILSDPAKRTARITDLRRARQLAATAKAEPGRNMLVTKPKPIEGEDEKRWEHLRRRGIAFARVVTERKPVNGVALELGLTEEAVLQLIEEERRTLPVQVDRHKLREAKDEWSKNEADRRQEMLTALRRKIAGVPA